MRPVRAIATGLLVVSLAIAGCGRGQPDQPTTTPPSGPIVTAPPAPPTPAPAPAPVPIPRPRILWVTTFPSVERDGGWLRLPATGTVTFRVRATHTQRVRFTLTPTGTNTADLTKLLGEDTNGRDGWTLAYTDKGGGHLIITAIGAGGSAQRMLNVYRLEPAPRILSLTTSPVLPRQGKFLRLPAGTGTVTFRVRAVNTQKVRFYLTPTGTGMFNENQLLGEDTNGRDGWTLTWRYQDEPLLAHLTVKAVGANGTISPGVVLGLYHPEPTT